MSQSGYVHLDVARVVKITEKAMLVKLACDDESNVGRWIPLSQVADADNYEEGDENLTVSVTEWWAKKEGLE